MRPAMRPASAVRRFSTSRRAQSPFVCPQCRPSYRPRCSGLGSAVRHASSEGGSPPDNEKIPFSEKFRRRMWGTDNPPGQKDPYSPASPEEMQRLREEEERLQEDEAQQAAERKGRGWLGRKRQPAVDQGGETGTESSSEIALEPPLDPPGKEELEELGYQPAQTWDGLPRIGGKYTRQMMVTEYMRDHPFEPYLPVEKADPSSARQIVHTALTQVLETREIAQAAGADDAAQSANDGGARSAVIDEETMQNYDISTDLQMKFALVKQVMRLSGRRIPDPAIAAFKTAGDLVAHMEAPQRTASVAEQLLALPALQALPNVEIYSRRWGSVSKDIEFGRAKVIEAELARRGLLGREPEGSDFHERLQAAETAQERSGGEEARKQG